MYGFSIRVKLQKQRDIPLLMLSQQTSGKPIAQLFDFRHASLDNFRDNMLYAESCFSTYHVLRLSEVSSNS